MYAYFWLYPRLISLALYSTEYTVQNHVQLSHWGGSKLTSVLSVLWSPLYHFWHAWYLHMRRPALSPLQLRMHLKTCLVQHSPMVENSSWAFVCMPKVLPHGCDDVFNDWLKIFRDVSLFQTPLGHTTDKEEDR